MGSINSPFRYAGGKYYARSLIREHIPPHEQYIEPFAGGGSIFFYKDKVEENWLNDVDSLLMNCYEVIRDQPEELIEALEGEKASKKRHHYFKEVFEPQDEIDEALRWYYLNRTSYSGIMKMQNCYWGYGEKYSKPPRNWPPTIRETSRKLQGVKLTSMDFEDVIGEASDGAFLFVDPPYFKADQDKFYRHSFTEEDHLRLLECLKKHSERLRFLLTYDNCPEIKDMYDWAFGIYDKEWNYTINRTDDQRKEENKNGEDDKEYGKRDKGKEVFIVNYDSINIEQLDMFEAQSA